MAHVWHALLEAAAALVLVVGGAGFIGLAWLERRSRRPDGRPGAAARPGPIPGETATAPIADRPLGFGQAVTALVAALSLGAAAVHFAATPAHVRELGAPGLWFLAAAGFQAAWAGVWLRRPGPAVALAGAVGHAAIVAAWFVSRTVGLPAALGGGHPETVGAPDAAATVFEVTILAVLALRAAGAASAVAPRLRNARSLPAITVVPAIGLVVVVASLASVLALGDPGHGGNGHGGDGHATDPHDARPAGDPADGGGAGDPGPAQLHDPAVDDGHEGDAQPIPLDDPAVDHGHEGDAQPTHLHDPAIDDGHGHPDAVDASPP